LKRSSKGLISKILLMKILNWVWKLFFIQKSQISVFGKYLNLFEFENVFDLNFNFGFKYKTAEKKFQKTFSSYSSQPIFHFGPSSLAAQSGSPYFFCFYFHAGPSVLPVLVVHPVIRPTQSFGPTQPAPSSPSSSRRPSRRHHRATLLCVRSPTEPRHLILFPSHNSTRPVTSSFVTDLLLIVHHRQFLLSQPPPLAAPLLRRPIKGTKASLSSLTTPPHTESLLSAPEPSHQRVPSPSPTPLHRYPNSCDPAPSRRLKRVPLRPLHLFGRRSDTPATETLARPHFGKPAATSTHRSMVHRLKLWSTKPCTKSTPLSIQK
jgi:hypothetical protein